MSEENPSVSEVTSWKKIQSLHEKNLAERGTKLDTSKCCTSYKGTFQPCFWGFMFSIAGAIMLHIFNLEAFSTGMMLKVTTPTYEFFESANGDFCSNDDTDLNQCFSRFFTESEDDVLRARIQGMTNVPDPFPQTMEEWADLEMNENLRDIFTVMARMGFKFTEDDDGAFGSKYAYVTYDEAAGTAKADQFAGSLLRPRPDGSAYTMGPVMFFEHYNTGIIWELAQDIIDDIAWWEDQDLTSKESILQAIYYKLPSVPAVHPYDWKEYNKDVMSVWMSFIFTFLLGYVMSKDAIKATKFIIDERQNGTKQLMEFLGLNQFQYWGSQFYTHMMSQIAPVFVTWLLILGFLSTADSDNDLGLGFGQSIYILFLLYITVINVTLYSFACSSVVRKDSIYDAWSLVSSMVFCFIPAIIMIGGLNSDNAGQRFVLQFIPLFNFAFGVRDSYKGIQGDTIFFHFFNTIFWAFMTWYLDLTVATLKGARAKECCFCINRSKDAQTAQSVELRMVKESLTQNTTSDKPLLVIKDLKKKFGDFVAVNGLSLELKMNEIYGLLGFNGAGKSTTINMITGQLMPSGGSIMIDGHDVTLEIESLRQIMGVCPQTNILWDRLTVMDHINLFGRLRGFTDAQIAEEAESLLNALEMDHRKDNLASNLSGGEKRKLMVAAAFLGDPQFILLDEPTAGVDIDSRDCIQKLILDRKKDKLIMLTTHHMSEADYLCDDIGIMADGQIAITGNPTQLKVEHGQGTTFMMKSETFGSEVAGIEEQFNSVDIKTEDGYYVVLCTDQEAVGPVLSTMEKHSKPGDIKIENNSLESVFLNLAKQRAKQSTRRSSMNVLGLNSKSEDDSNDIIKEIGSRSYSRPSCMRQAVLLSQKRVMIMYKDMAPIIRGIMIVLFMAVLNIFFLTAIGWKNTPSDWAQIGDLTENNNKFPVYGSSQADCDFNVAPYNKEHMCTYMYSTYGEHKDGIPPTMADYKDFPKYASWGISQTDNNITVPAAAYKAAVSGGTRAVMSYSNADEPTAVELVGYVAETELHYVRCINTTTLTCSPLYSDCSGTNEKKTYEQAVADCPAGTRPPTVKEVESMKFVGTMPAYTRTPLCGELDSTLDESCAGGTFWTVDTPVEDRNKTGMMKAFNFMSPYYVGTTQAVMRYQYAGMDPQIKEGGAFDIGGYLESIIAAFFFMTGSAMMVCALYKYTAHEIDSGMFEQQKLMGVDTRLMYAVAFVWDFTICLFTVILFCLVTDPSSDNFRDTIESWTVASFSFILAMYAAGTIFDYDRLNTIVTAAIGFLIVLCYFVLPSIDENCWMKILNVKSEDFDPFDEDDNGPMSKGQAFVWRFLMYLTPPTQYILSQQLAVIKTNSNSFKLYDSVTTNHWLWAFFGGTLFWVILFILSQMNFKSDPKEESVMVKDEDLKLEHNADNVVSDTISKVFLDGKGNKLIAVNKVSFSVQKGRCTGVLGKNGAGKSTTMNILSTLFGPSAGRGMIHNKNCVRDVQEIRSWIGICNQKNIYWKDFTVREHLTYFGQLRGIPAEDIESVIVSFANELKFIEHMGTKMDQLSGGNKRKVALCVSVLGAADVLYLDEPSAGVDPFARDEMKNVLVKLKEGRTVLFTSHTMEEAEIMCDDVVIMVKGFVEAAGEVNDLITEQSKGYFLQIDISSLDEQQVKDVASMIEDMGNVTPRPAQKAELIYSVDFNTSLSKVFATTTNLEKSFGCKCIVESANLAQLFKHVVRQGDEEEEENAGDNKRTIP